MSCFTYIDGLQVLVSGYAQRWRMDMTKLLTFQSEKKKCQIMGPLGPAVTDRPHTALNYEQL